MSDCQCAGLFTCERIRLIEHVHAAVLAEALALRLAVEDAVGQILAADDNALLFMWVTPNIGALHPVSVSPWKSGVRRVLLGLTRTQTLQLQSMTRSSPSDNVSHVSSGFIFTASLTTPQWQLP